MATENKKEMGTGSGEIRANLFGGYEQGRDPWADPWASGGYQPEPETVAETAQETVQEIQSEPQQELPTPELLPKPVRQSTLVERVIPTVPLPKPLNLALANAASKREAAQRELDLYRERKRAERSREEAQYSILDGVVWSIREALRAQCISVSCLENVCYFQHKPIVSHVEFDLTEIGKTNFKAVVAQRFVDEFLKHNPKRVHMLTARTLLPQGVLVARHFVHDGLLLRGIGVYNIATDSHRVRVDCTYAIATEENLICQTQTGVGQIQPG